MQKTKPEVSVPVATAGEKKDNLKDLLRPEQTEQKKPEEEWVKVRKRNKEERRSQSKDVDTGWCVVFGFLKFLDAVSIW